MKISRIKQNNSFLPPTRCLSRPYLAKKKKKKRDTVRYSALYLQVTLRKTEHRQFVFKTKICCTTFIDLLYIDRPTSLSRSG